MSSTSSADSTHVTPLRVYLTVGGLLLLLTVVTVLVSQVHLGTWNLVVALTIAAIKASLVAFFFMHLYYDHKFYFVLFLVGVLFLALFIGFSMIDTMRRGDLYREVAAPIHAPAAIYGTPADSSHSSGHAADSAVPPAVGH
ncbi:MAG: cytochrome C oxidase subunit IV family protein [Candidatus Zixiibacteriota bacterium]